MTTTFYKSTIETLDYQVDWNDVLGEATIVTSDWDVPAPLTKSSESFAGGITTVFIGGGVAGSYYTITNTIETSELDVISESFIILCAPTDDRSGIAIFNVTRDEIIKLALEDIKVYAPDFQDPSPGEISRASKRLNLMIKAWQASGVGLWLNTTYTLPLEAATTSYLLGPGGNPPIPRPLSVVEARIVSTSGNELSMVSMSRDEYMMLSLKTSLGKPTQYYYDPQMVNGVFYSWPVASDITDVIKMTLRTPVQDFVESDNTPDFPVEWADALHYGLAVRLLSVYDVPDRIAQKVIGMAQVALRDVDGFDREQNVSLQFAPDMGY